MDKRINEIEIQKYKLNIEDSNIDVISISSNDLEIPEIINDDTNVIALSSENSYNCNAIVNIDKINETDDSLNAASTFNNIDTGNLDNNVINNQFDDICESDNCSYHSSDFEFITEEEAYLDGFIINFSRKTHDKEFKDKTVNKIAYIDNKGINLPNIDNNRHLEDIFNYRDNHIIPEGDDYLNLFQGIYAPIYNSCFMENKSVRSNRTMNVEMEGIGFDIKLLSKKHMEENLDMEFKDEAEETARKILNTYPAHNRKRRRRH